METIIGIPVLLHRALLKHIPDKRHVFYPKTEAQLHEPRLFKHSQTPPSCPKLALAATPSKSFDPAPAQHRPAISRRPLKTRLRKEDQLIHRSRCAAARKKNPTCLSHHNVGQQIIALHQHFFLKKKKPKRSHRSRDQVNLGWKKRGVRDEWTRQKQPG